MKNKFKYISFLLLFVCVMFGFESNVKGEYSCTYLYDPSARENGYVSKNDALQIAMVIDLHEPSINIDTDNFGRDFEGDIRADIAHIEEFIVFFDDDDVSVSLNVNDNIATYSMALNTISRNNTPCPEMVGLYVSETHYKGPFGIPVTYYNYGVAEHSIVDYDSIEQMKNSIRSFGQIVFIRDDLVNSESIKKCVKDEQINSLKNLLDKIPDIQSFTQYIDVPENMPNYDESISKLSYFNGNCSSVTSQIKKDKEELGSILSGDMITCMKNNWPQYASTSEIEILKRYFMYFDDPDEGRYIADNLQTLPTIYSNLLSKENLESICEANEEKALMKDVSGIHDDERTQDLARKAKDINCEALYSATNDQLNSVQKYVKEKSNEVCQFSDKLCFISNCELIKKDLVDSAKDIASGKKQEEAEKVLSGLKTNWFNHDKVELNGKLCDTLNSNEIRPYIKGTLNVIMIAGPILTIILTILDGIKTFASMKDDEQKKFFDKLKIRLLCVALLILVPTIINFLLKFISDSFCKIV